MRTCKRAFVCTMLLILILSTCAPATANPPPEERHLTFMAGFRPQANLPFVGVYVAQEKGFFAEEHLVVDIQHSAGGGEHLQLLIAGKVDITTQDAAVLLKRRADPGLPLLSIALIGQRGQQAFVALEESNIRSLADWRGRRIGFKGTPPPDLLALLDIAGLSEQDVELINVGFDPRLLVEGLVDIYPVFNSNEPYLLRSWGYRLVSWEAADFGYPSMGLTYVTTPEIAEADPARITSFLRAALRGISYAQANPDEAIEIALRYVGAEADPDHMRFMLGTELRDAHGPATVTEGIGWQTAEQWQALMDSLLTYDAISGPVDVEQVFTTRYLKP